MRQHSGIDIAARHGANVLAADRGTVITSRFNSSYGNYIVIAHGENRNGDRITTLYAHLSTRSVSVGDVVEQGQVIGRIGSTGVSTGPHLHFEVMVNGTRVNPMRFL
ncbi:MAG: M23 family metallopeptidase [Oscillospiraceae bacterium]|nr:M23 family metallopeptidase [Oscillospiraceae bacterium]